MVYSPDQYVLSSAVEFQTLVLEFTILRLVPHRELITSSVSLKCISAPGGIDK